MKNRAARSRSRKFLVQALYQALLTGETIESVIEPFILAHKMQRADIPYFRDLLSGIHTNLAQLRQTLSAKLDRGYEELDPVETAILLLGAEELSAHPQVPYKIVINEAVELAKLFGATDSYKYINAVLDALAQDLESAGTDKGLDSRLL